VQRRKIPVAAIQTAAHDRKDFVRAWPHVLALVDRAGRDGARLIVLPEATVPAYVLGYERVASEQLDSAQRDLGELARRHTATIVYGGAKNVGGITFNAAIAIGPRGEELGFAAKQFLWHFDRLWFAPGAALQPVASPLGTLGLLVCADGRIPTIAATLVDRGAEILVMPTAWVTSGRNPQALENVQADLMVNVRARENGVAFVAANKSGVELASVAYCGKSTLVDASGHTLARASERDEEILAGEVEIGRAARATVPPFDAFGSQPPAREGSHTAVRFAFTPAADPAEQAELEALALRADARALLSASDAACTGGGRVFETAGVRMAAVSGEALGSPRGLVAARLAGIDAFLCAPGGDPAWHEAIARTRAAELRAYVVIFADGHRAFAVDPDGTIVAGTFDGYRVAAFVYDAGRTAATAVAPSTDVLAGMRTAEGVRAG
jgi:predicted amidohydrolase